jgi:hypothetical protein
MLLSINFSDVDETWARKRFEHHSILKIGLETPVSFNNGK